MNFYKLKVLKSIVAQSKTVGSFRAPKLVSLDKDWSGFSFKYAG